MCSISVVQSIQVWIKADLCSALERYRGKNGKRVAHLLNLPLLPLGFLQRGENLVLRGEEGVDVDVAVCGLGGVRQDGGCCASDVGNKTNVGFGVAGVVNCGFLGLEVEAEEGGAETPG